jgi:AmmeMemoRadiSam system protein B
MNRKPAVAGQFYPSSSSKLSEQISTFIRPDTDKKPAIGIVSPHAGIMYSGGVAGAVFSRIEFPRTFVLLGPNHTGYGSPVSLMSSGEWEVPTGKLKIDQEISAKLLEKSGFIEEDSLAHQMEHSLEVQLPFILHFSQNVNIVPIIMMADSFNDCELLGEALSDVILSAGYPVTIVASSDMSHYTSDSAAREIDKKAIDMITALDPHGLYNIVKGEGITMCGILPVTAMLCAAKKMGAKEASLIKYATSGEVSGDYDYVVGYAGMIIR